MRLIEKISEVFKAVLGNNREQAHFIDVCDKGLNELALELLREKPSLAKARNKQGQTPLHIAAQLNNTALAAALLRNEADINAQDRQGFSPLMVATLHNEPFFHILLEHSADADLRDHEGKTALYHAAERGRIIAVNALLQSGANALIPDHRGITPAERAQLSNQEWCGELITLYLREQAEKQREAFERQQAKDCALIQKDTQELFSGISQPVKTSSVQLIKRPHR